MLHVLAGLRDCLGFELQAAHVSHGLVAGSEAWFDTCARLCDALGVELSLSRVQVSRTHPEGLESAAREARRAALDRLGSAMLVLAHHRDDQAETVLFRAVRGAGPHGVAGMRSLDLRGPNPVWRPLLAVPRQALEAYARLHALSWVEDPSNQDLRFSRNFLRHAILPSLNARFPGAGAALARLGRLSAEAIELLDERADEDLSTLCREGQARWALAGWQSLAPARRRNLLRRLLTLAGERPPDEDRLLEMERQLCEAGAGEGRRLPWERVALCAYRGDLWLEAALLPMPSPLYWHGEAQLGWAGGEIRVERGFAVGLSRALLAGRSCEFRPRQGGERLELHPGGPSRSLKNLFQEAGVPPWLRAHLPLLWVDGALAWVAGVGVAAAFRCLPGQEGDVLVWSRMPVAPQT